MIPNPLDMRMGGLFSGSPRPPEPRNIEREVLNALYKAKVALYDAHALTRNGGEEAYTSTDSPYWRAFCDIEQLFLDKRNEVWPGG